jgi:hypothetical protein
MNAQLLPPRRLRHGVPRPALGRTSTAACGIARFEIAKPQAAVEGRTCPWLRLAAVLLVCGWLLFAHGCHGDEDNELFARLLSAARPSAAASGSGTPPQ